VWIVLFSLSMTEVISDKLCLQLPDE
jgi:hypothetical protein